MATEPHDAEIELGLECYDPEHTVFKRLPDKIKSGIPLSKRDLLLIVKWKTTRVKGDHAKTVTDAAMAKINRAIADAPNRKIDALNSLDRISGIGLAVATSILTLCYPDEFTIIDRRVLGQLHLLPKRLADKRKTSAKPLYTTNDWTAEEYVNEYLPKVKAYSKQAGCSLRNADRALWGLSVHKDIENLIRKSTLS
jgi:hypothetical protein